MNEFDGQLLLTLTCVAVAVAVLLRRIVGLVRNPKGCGSGGCGSCPSKTTSPENGFVSLESLAGREDR